MHVCVKSAVAITLPSSSFIITLSVFYESRDVVEVWCAACAFGW